MHAMEICTTIACAALVVAVGHAAPPAAKHTITQANKQFSQTEITVKVGDSIAFENDDEVTHNVYSATPGLSFETQRQTPGSSSVVPFTHEGTVLVECSIHPKMKLTVHVQK